MDYGLIGEHLSHSFSKEIHGKLFPYSYELCEIKPEKIGEFMTAKNFKAINVTIPYKQTVMPYLDEIDPAAEKIGAVNTVVNRDGVLIGYNTDFLGLRALIKKSGVSLSGKKVLILGSGGTSKTAAVVCESLGAGEVYRLSRKASAKTVSYDDAYKAHTDAAVIINTTPCGMFPNNGSVAVDIERFPSLVACFDAVYNPLRSALILKARKRGIVAEGGLYMLVAQAVFAAEYFTGQSLPEGTIDRVYSEILSEKQNLVLIGMPGSGKTTLGKMVARELGFEFFDTDVLITEMTGKTPAEIITAEGETAFRDIESEAVSRVSAKSAAVIATGGGAILREENLLRLCENGKIIFLDRELRHLAVTDDRPLSSDLEKLSARYRERYPRYMAAADKRIECVYSKEANVLKIKEAFLNEN